MMNAENKVETLMRENALANCNSLWAWLLVEVLKRLGLEYAVISPGSRSTPLTYAFACEDAIDAIPVLDERSAAFFALGLAKKSHKPVVLLCTSGTASANYFPAIIEAKESGIPLLVLSTDRPQELRQNHSGQSIDQVKLFGNYPVFQSEMPLPENSEESILFLRQRLLHAWEMCLQPAKGPVHLNFPFKEPLIPQGNADCRHIFESYNFSDFFKVIQRFSYEGISSKLPDLCFSTNGIIVAGTVQGMDDEAYCKAVFKLAKKLSWPVLADPLGPWRNWVKPEVPIVTLYDTILANKALHSELKPSSVLQVGQLPTSKNLRQFLQDNPCQTWICDAGFENQDPLNRGACHLRLDLVALEKALSISNTEQESKLMKHWLNAQQLCEKALNENIMKCDFLFEGLIPQILSENLPVETKVFISNSMPVRDCENFWKAGDYHYSIYCNRGANGIDGILSTAMGIAHKEDYSVLLSGDLSLLHDSNGFLILPEFKGHLTIVLINNNGGGIFENLAISQFEPQFERFFATPQNLDFKKLAELHNVEHIEIRSFEDLAKRIKVVPQTSLRILELKTNRKRDVEYRKSILKKASAEVKI